MRYLLPLILLPSLAWGACDCGSTDGSNPCTGTSISVTVTNVSVNNFGTPSPAVFNWTFNSGGGAARCGQFANGDYWIAPAAGQSSVTITALTTTSPGGITLDENPRAGSYGLGDGAGAYAGYNGTENIQDDLPQSFSSNTSLVAAIQRDEATEGNCNSDAPNECFNAYNAVTILTAVPANAGSDMIRPNIVGTTKELLTLSDFDLSRIPSISYFSGTDASGLETIRMRWAHTTEIFGLGFSTDGITYYGNSTGGRGHRGYLLVHNYAAGMAMRLADDLRMIMSSSTTADDTAAIASILASGLDMYHAYFDYTSKWGSGAGQHLGKITATVFLAALEENNSTRLNNVKSIAALDNSMQPQELAQLHVGPNGPVWGDMDSITRYWNDYIWAGCYDDSSRYPCTYDQMDVGQKGAADPHKYIDGPANKPGEFYFPIGYAGILNFASLMCLIPEFADAVNTTKPIDFVYRAKTHGLQTAPDPCIGIDTREDFGSCSIWTGGTGCDYYYPTASVLATWGPKSLTNADAGCATVEDLPYAKAGRFTSMDGDPAPINTGYVSAAFNSNWTSIYAAYDAPDCSSDPDYCATESECETAGWYWYDSECHSTAEPTCATHASLCTSEADCGTYWPAYNWCTDTCQAAECGGGGGLIIRDGDLINGTISRIIP